MPTDMIGKPWHICGYVLLFLTICSCEDVINLDLNTAEARYVIEANITDRQGDSRVFITRTRDFDADNNFVGISGATVSITDNHGNITLLEETDSGTYEAPSLVAATGNTYTLNVIIDKQVFTATSTMPERVDFDSLYISNDLLFGEFWLLSNIEFRDPPSVANYYNFIQWVNGRRTREFYPANDEYTDGNLQTVKLYMPDNMEDEYKTKSGDTIQVEMQCIDAAVYRYWFSAQQGATGINESAAPANPVSNIVGGALGYFSAHTVQVRTIRVP